MQSCLYNNTESALNGRFWPGAKAALKPLTLILTIPMVACQTTDIVATDLSCDAFGPISWSRSDTTETAKQIRDHNAAWKALCFKKEFDNQR